MMYYNPITQDIKTHTELCIINNAYLAQNIQYFNGYHRVYKKDKPIYTEYQTITENPIQLIDGKYYITYTLSYKPLDKIKEIRYKQIEDLFEEASSSAFITSSLGFRVDANEIANRNVDGLIKVLKSYGREEELFRDYDNNFHNVTLNDLEKMQLEIIENGQNLYKQKWKFLNDISLLTNEEDVVSYKIIFNNMDFLNDNK